MTRPFTIRGVVEHGAKLGRTLGFPTANLRLGDYQRPAYGVYAVMVTSRTGSPVRGVANYGLRPTVEQTVRPLLEVHLLAPSALTYGDEVSVQWLHFLRPEAKFSGLDELRAQIARDRQSALEYFAKSPGVEKPNNA